MKTFEDLLKEKEIQILEEKQLTSVKGGIVIQDDVILF